MVSGVKRVIHKWLVGFYLYIISNCTDCSYPDGRNFSKIYLDTDLDKHNVLVCFGPVPSLEYIHLFDLLGKVPYLSIKGQSYTKLTTINNSSIRCIVGADLPSLV